MSELSIYERFGLDDGAGHGRRPVERSGERDELERRACFYCGSSPAPYRFSGAPERNEPLCIRCLVYPDEGGVSCEAIEAKLAEVRARPLISRVDPPPAVLTLGLTPEQHAQVQRYADLLRAGPLDREAQGREALRVWEANGSETADECLARIIEHGFRLGAASGDSPLREAVRDLWDAWLGPDAHATQLAAQRLFCVYAQGPEPLPTRPVDPRPPAWTPAERDMLARLAAADEDTRRAAERLLRSLPGLTAWQRGAVVSTAEQFAELARVAPHLARAS